MERGARLALSVLVASMLLAGCLKGDAEESVDAALADNESDIVAEAPDGRGRIVAFEETNKTAEGIDGMHHGHDMWNGATRIVLLEDTVGVPLTVDGGSSTTLRPEMLSLVYEGTATVEITLSAPQRFGQADPSSPRPPTLFYRHAATTDWIQAGEPQWDTPLAIQVTDPVQTDMPHASWSLWAFRLTTADPQANGLSFGFEATIVRGEGEIPEWPGHPDLYADSPQRRVLEADVHTAQNGLTGDAIPVEESDGEIAPTQVVSYGTRTLHVFVNITNFEVTNPLDEPTNFFLWFHNASGYWNVTNIFDSENYSADKKEHVFVLAVRDDGMDSPYASGSRWGFELGAAFMQGVKGVTPRVSCYSGCATWSSDYHITVIASTEVLPEDAYDAIA